MKIHELTIGSGERDGGFALPPLPEELSEQYRVLRVHVRAEGGAMWWRRDGGDVSDTTTSYRIATNQIRSLEGSDEAALARFRFDGAEALTVVYEGLEAHAWLKERRELTQDEFAQPIKAANSGREQARINHGKSVVEAVLSTNPGETIPGSAAPPTAADEASPAWAGTEDPGRAQALAKAKAAQAAVFQSWQPK